jgi:MYXO-CTERM domain-containing protein
MGLSAAMTGHAGGADPRLNPLPTSPDEEPTTPATHTGKGGGCRVGGGATGAGWLALAGLLLALRRRGRPRRIR